MIKNNKKSIIDRLANSIQTTFSTKLVFSEPIETNGVIVIPVAKISYGFGGGSGKNHTKKGNGGGAGAFAQPIGYIEIKEGKTQFISIHNPLTTPSAILAGGIACYYLLKGIAKLFK